MNKNMLFNEISSKANASFKEVNHFSAKVNASLKEGNTSLSKVNASFKEVSPFSTKVNASSTKANPSYGEVNTSYGKANTLYGEVNPSYGKANPSYGKVNTSYGKANTSYGITKECLAKNDRIRINKLEIIKLFLFLFLFCTLCLKTPYAQTPKGFSVIKQEEKKVEGKTYALIIGISTYKNPAIPALQFADKDAIAFSNYLVATGVDSNNITLLINEKATNGEFWASINYLTDITKQGDKVFIYFSGHGDVENKTVVKDAYLLPYDAPKCVYPSGAIGIYYLKNWIATLSSKGIQVVFIADACRSGNLAGGREGMEAAAEVLKDKWVDEIKILSCQPGELSVEGKQWGNGRGLFSFELVNGISGLADKNKDGKVSLRELNLYLMEKVPEENPLPQNPMVEGNMEATIATINPKLLAEISLRQSTSSFASIDTRGFDETLLKNLHDSIKVNYHLFKTYLDSGILIRKDPSPSANLYYNRVPDNNSTKLLRALMKRNFSAALLERLNEVKSLLMNSNSSQVFYVDEIEKTGKLVREILGDVKLKSMGALPGILAAEASSASATKDPENIKEGLSKLDSSIMLESHSAMLYFLRALAKLNASDMTAVADLNKAIELSPKFFFAYQVLVSLYDRMSQFHPAVEMGYRMLKADSSFTYTFLAYKVLARAYFNLGKIDSAGYYVNKTVGMINSDPQNKGIMAEDLGAIGGYYSDTKNYPKAIEFYLKGMNYVSENKEFHDLVADSAFAYYNISCCYSLMTDKSNALKYFELSLQNGFKDFRHIGEDTDLDNIRSSAEFTAIMKKYFPDQTKQK